MKTIYTLLCAVVLVGMTFACSEPPSEPALVEVTGVEETEPETILFLCPHGAAKSVMASAYFEKLSAEKGLRFHITSAGTEPDAMTAPVVVKLLKEEGIDVSDRTPRLVTAEELGTAYRVISMGCDVSNLAPESVSIEHWDIPDFSADAPTARNAIYSHVARLVDELNRKETLQ